MVLNGCFSSCCAPSLFHSFVVPLYIIIIFIQQNRALQFIAACVRAYSLVCLFKDKRKTQLPIRLAWTACSNLYAQAYIQFSRFLSIRFNIYSNNNNNNNRSRKTNRANRLQTFRSWQTVAASKSIRQRFTYACNCDYDCVSFIFHAICQTQTME